MSLRAGKPLTNNFPFIPDGKLMVEGVLTNNFPFIPDGKLMVE